MGEHSKQHKTDIVVVGWNHQDSTHSCISSVHRNTDEQSFRVIYVDNGSKFDYAYSRTTRVYLPTNTGYCHGTNVGLALSLLNDSEYVLLLNNDTRIPEGDTTWLERLIEPMERDANIGSVGAVSDTVTMYQFRPERGGAVSTVPILIGFCQLIRKTALEQVGLLDERFDPDGNFTDWDYSLRLNKAGWKQVVAESVWIHHEGRVTQNDLGDYNALLAKGRRLLVEKWGEQAAELRGL